MTEVLEIEKRPAWQRVIELFSLHHAPAPPWRLRDELVSWLVAKDELDIHQRCENAWQDIAPLLSEVERLTKELTSLRGEVDEAREALKLGHRAIVAMSAISDGKFSGASLFRDNDGRWYTREDVLDAVESAFALSAKGV
jgi:hypothetical protein